MKTEFSEYENGASIHLTPETMAEVNKLLRTAANTASLKAVVNFYFNGEQPVVSIHLRKISKEKQIGVLRRDLLKR